MKEKMVSIIMPCHNGERYIRQSVNSVINQQYTNWELLVVDDKSSDSSVGIVKGMAMEDNRVKLLFNNKSTGRPASPRNFGIEQAQGEYIAFLDCDDYWAESHLTNILNMFNDENVIAAFSWYERVDEEGNNLGIVKTPDAVAYHHLFYDNFIGNLTGIYSVKKVGKVYQKECGHEDYLMWLSILKAGGIAKSCNTVEAFYRVTNNSVSSNKIKALRWRWNILRNEIRLPKLVSAYYLISSLFIINLKKSQFSSLLRHFIKVKDK